MPQLEHIEAIEKRLWSAADNLRANSNYASNDGLLIAFDDILESLFSQIFTLAQANIKLSHARDLLLPRLMSGEVAV